MQPILTLKSNGELSAKYWDSKSRRWRQKNVTDHVVDCLFWEVNLDSDVVLEDVFLLLRSEMDFFKRLYGPMCESLVTEAFEDFTVKDIEYEHSYLSVSWRLYAAEDIDEQIKIHFTHPDFECIEIDPETNQETALGLDLCSPASILKTPVRLKSELTFYPDVNTDKHKYVYAASYTLNDLFLAIIKELSFYGDKQKRADIIASLERAADEIRGRKSS